MYAGSAGGGRAHSVRAPDRKPAIAKSFAIQKGRTQKKQAVAPVASSFAEGSTADTLDDTQQPWVPGDQVMYVYGDGVKERLVSCLA
jgi:hypothetical protein